MTVGLPAQTEEHPEPSAGRGGVRRALAILLALAAVGAGVWFGARSLARLVSVDGGGPSATTTPIEPGQPVTVTIRPGSSARAIGDQLERQGVIGSALEFEIAVRTSGLAASLKAGEYELITGIGVEDAISILEQGPVVATFWVTIPEGLRLGELLDAVAEQSEIPRPELEAALLDDSVSTSLLERPVESIDDWEGLLFPDTYEFAVGSDPAVVLGRMARTMEERVAAIDWAAAEEAGFTLYEAIIIASMIEAEAQVDRDRPLVASVIYNRTEEGMRLDIDATVAFAVGKRGGLTASDLEVDSPYNTRKFPGLPPGPIGASGRASLEAAAQPADTDYLYYVLADADGSHAFTADYGEFLRLKEEAQAAGLIP